MRNTLWIGFVFFSCAEYHKYLIFSTSVVCTYLYFWCTVLSPIKKSPIFATNNADKAVFGI